MSYLRPYAHIIWTDHTTGISTALHLWCVSRQHQADVKITEHAVEDGSDITDNARPNPINPTITAFISNEPVEAPFFSQQCAETQGAIDAFNQTATIIPNSTAIDPLLQLPNAGLPPAVQVLSVKDWFSAGEFLGLLLGNLAAFEVRSIKFPQTGLAQEYSPTMNATTLRFDEQFDAVNSTLATIESLRDASTLLTVVTQEAVYENCLIQQYSLEKTHDTGTGANLTISFRSVRLVSTQKVSAPTPVEPRGSGTVSAGSQSTAPATAGATIKSFALAQLNKYGILQ